MRPTDAFVPLVNVLVLCFLPGVLMYAGSWLLLANRLPFGQLFSIGLFSVVFAGAAMLGMWWFCPPWWMVAALTSMGGCIFVCFGLRFHFHLPGTRRVLIAMCAWLPLALWLGVLMHGWAMAPPQLGP